MSVVSCKSRKASELRENIVDLQLSLQKQEMFNKVYEKEKAFALALEKFDAINGL